MTTRTAVSDLAQTTPDPAPARVWAVLPVKVLSKAKQRMASCLGASREGFALAMLDDVLRALAGSRMVGRVACVTADPRVAALAAEHGALVVDEGRLRGMNEAIGLGIDTARKHGGERVVVLPADLPLASGAEIDRLLKIVEASSLSGEQAVIGLNPAANSRGTNFLCLDTARPFETRFGPDSFHEHQACARARGLRTVVLDSETLSIDIDTERDLQDLISYCSRHTEYQCTSSWKYLHRHGLAGATGQTG